MGPVGYWAPTVGKEGRGNVSLNPTSPLGLGGLAWGVCFQPLFFQPFWFQPSGEGFTPPPTPALKTPPLPWIRLRTF